MKKLFIDYEICNKCPECVVKCSYIFHPGNNGITSLREQIAFLFACRRCDDYPCVNACPANALKRNNGIIERSNFLCISCKSCAIACPFGTIAVDLLLYLTTRCDICTGSRVKEKDRFICVNSCPYSALKIVDEENLKEDKHIHKIGESIIVKAVNWLDIYDVTKK